MSEFTVYAAIDLAGGKAVRLWQGDRARSRVVADDPVDLARQLVAGGARFLHVVDLDAAFADGENRAVIARIVAAAGVPVQVGGGVRNRAAFDALVAAGVARVVLGTLVVDQPDVLAPLLAADPERVVVAADVRGRRVVADGWRRDGGDDLAGMGARMRAAGARYLLVTAVERDGTGSGPDHAVLQQALAAFGPGVIASGGIGSVEDVARLAPLAAQGLAGVVVGSLLVDGRASAADLLRAVSGFDGDAAGGGDAGAATIAGPGSGVRGPDPGHRTTPPTSECDGDGLTTDHGPLTTPCEGT
jgi:phosphoribosylformimino-5-aminoimidazole carboxamide ribotide isomerase